MVSQFEDQVAQTLEEIKAQGLFKTERVITSPQDAHIAIMGGKRVLNMCANNYLGLADHPALIAAAKEALETHGFGMTSVRFICGTQDIHKELEAALSRFLGTEDTILDPSCFDASGGFTSGRKEIVALLRQRSRPYLFSNTIAPPVVAASLKALELLSASTELRDKLEENTKYFRAALTERGLTIKPGVHPIVPIMIGDAAKSQKFAARMLEKGVYVIGFFYPVVPHGTARVRTQVSAAHSREDLEFAVN